MTEAGEDLVGEDLVGLPKPRFLGLEELLARRHVTTRELARRVGVHPNTVGRWRRGQRAPSGDDLVAVARALRLSPCELVGEVFAGVEHVLTCATVPPCAP